jgi:putative ABC transport system permease protein
MIGYDPASHIFIPDSINRQTAVLARVDSVLVDSSTRPIFGPLDTGRVVEIDDSKVTIGGQYALGTGFMGLGVALASTANFARLFPQRGSTIVNLGAIRLKAGVDPDRAAGVLQKLTGARIFTRQELEAHETAYWTTRTSVGIIFGSGLDLARGWNHDRVPDRVHPGWPAIAAIRDLESDRLSRPRSSRDG